MAKKPRRANGDNETWTYERKIACCAMVWKHQPGYFLHPKKNQPERWVLAKISKSLGIEARRIGKQFGMAFNYDVDYPWQEGWYKAAAETCPKDVNVRWLCFFYEKSNGKTN
jgi:hypothetical protein